MSDLRDFEQSEKEEAQAVSNLVFVSGDFCSGSTLLFTLFRKTKEFYCLYEPLHEKLQQYLLWRLRPYEHHFYVDNYFTEYRGFDQISKLQQPKWGASHLYIPATAQEDALYRYLSYLIGTSFGRLAKVMLKENRFTFRLGWLRAQFPQARVVHIWRDCEEQWRSNIRRGQAHFGREDIGQDAVTFNGANIATHCEDLKDTFPVLAAEHSRTGFERFSKLWALSKAEGQCHADVSVNYRDLVHDFGRVFPQIREVVGIQADPRQLERFVVPPERQQPLAVGKGWLEHALDLVDRVGTKQARARLRLQRLGRAAAK